MTQDSDLIKAAPLINSNGNWGWATIVIQSNDLNVSKWQRFMNEARRLHVQPIVRLATTFQNGSWTRPTESNIDDFASFLIKLNWPTKKLPVVLFNEINHGAEWGGQVDVKNYTDIAIYATTKLKQTSDDFIIMGAGMDLAAPEKPPNFKSAEIIYEEIKSYKPEYFENLDALASHSYPNPGFAGLPTDTGRMSILGYDWELSLFKKLQVKSDYPVYITETGWPAKTFTRNTTSKFNMMAHDIWLKDERIQAITYFTFNYPYPPFSAFSWVDTGEELHQEYSILKNIDKGTNLPEQLVGVEYKTHRLPLIIFSDFALEGEIELKNTGQSIWGEKTKCFDPLPNDFQSIPLCTDKSVEPGETHTFTFTFRIPKNYPHDIHLEWEKVPTLILPKINDQLDIYQGRETIFAKIGNEIKKFIK